MARPDIAWLISLSFLGATSLVVPGCGSGTSPPGGGTDLVDNGFESDDPNGRNSQDFNGGRSADGGASAPSAGASDDDDAESTNGDANRAIEEADIIKQEGNRLYALSRYGGLAVVDITDPDHLKLVGRKRTDGIPFEMYVRNGRAYVMLNDFGRYVRTADSPYGQWVQSSEIVAIDVTTPQSMTEFAHYDVPGTIADSRIVGDALYLVTYENGYCWRCSDKPATNVTSFNVAGAGIGKVDQIAFTSPRQGYSSWQRSVSATNERLYVAGPEWNWDGQGNTANSIIQVVDITDPTGHLVKGADVSVQGQINSRWQMDEYAGVLRVISQFNNGWGGGSGVVNPKVQTFTVNSASSIVPLGQTELTLPKPESLRSVRFDGTRGYAITAEQTDPLFTIDLTDPAAPKQAGALEMPGWILHMEPRGDRLVGFGFDNTNGGALAVSLFDVSDLSKPTMLKRVQFGSGWGSFAEDQDRIHKSVQVLDDKGLVLVPFASYGRWDNGNCAQPQSGIQLISYSHDDIALRGVAPQYGQPRRAFLANGRLLAVSDRNVTSFNVDALDAPTKTGEIDLSNPAYKMTEVNGQIASITNDWWSGEVMLSLTPKEGADDAAVTGKLSLASLATPSPELCSGNAYAWTSWYQARLMANGNTVYVTVPSYSYGNQTRGGKVIIGAVDVSNPQKPALIGKTELKLTERDTSSGYGYWYYGDGFWDGYGLYSYYGGSSGSLVPSGQGLVQVGTKLAYLEVEYEYIPKGQKDQYGNTQYETKLHRHLHVADMANPAAPTVFAPIDLGDSLGFSPLHVLDGTVLTSRWTPSDKNPDKVRFFADRIDLNGAAPTQLSSINIPGSLLMVDAPSKRLVTTDYTATRANGRDWESCRQLLGDRAWFDYQNNRCLKIDRNFKLATLAGTKVTLNQTWDPPSQYFSGVQTAEDRVYVTRYPRYDYSNGSGGVNAEGDYVPPKVIEDGGMWVLGGIRAGQMSIVSEMKGDAQWPLAAFGSKVALYTQGGLAIYDTNTPAPKLLSESNLRGWGYSSQVILGADRAICSLGEWGLQTIKY